MILPYPHINPEIFSIGPFAVRWYGMMYVLGFAASYFLALYQLRDTVKGITRAQIDDIYFYLVVGLLAGARLGYILFYNLSYYVSHPLEVFVLWHGGMSFHGGALGTFLMGWWAIRRRGLSFLKTADLIIVTAPIGIFFGRMGNFINGELFGRVTNVPWAMVFPEGGPLPRHPSQLYEGLLEGLVLFFILWLYRTRKKYEGEVFALFLMGYAVFRIFCECFREPDAQVGYFLGLFTMGQILSFVMFLTGLVLRLFVLPRLGQGQVPSAKARGGKK